MSFSARTTCWLTIHIVYYGEEQEFTGAYNPVNREPMWPTQYKNNTTPLPSLIRSLNKLRSYAIGDGKKYSDEQSGGNDYLSYLSYPVFNSSHVVAFRKGYTGNQVIFVLSNLGSHPGRSPEKSFTLSSTGSGFHPRQNITEIISCKSLLAESDSGDVDVDLDDGQPRVYYPTDSLNNSGICGHVSSSSDSSGSLGGGTTTSTTGSGYPKPTKSGASVFAGQQSTLLAAVVLGCLFTLL